MYIHIPGGNTYDGVSWLTNYKCASLLLENTPNDTKLMRCLIQPQYTKEMGRTPPIIQGPGCKLLVESKYLYVYTCIYIYIYIFMNVCISTCISTCICHI